MAAPIWTSRDGKTFKVLMLEDDEQLATTLKVFLESNACKVTQVENGVEGLRRVMDEDFDLVLCDMVMPKFPGDKFYLAVERVKPALCRRFLFMSPARCSIASPGSKTTRRTIFPCSSRSTTPGEWRAGAR